MDDASPLPSTNSHQGAIRCFGFTFGICNVVHLYTQSMVSILSCMLLRWQRKPSTNQLKGVWVNISISSVVGLTTAESLGMSLTLFCTSSSVTSNAVQCSSSRGRGSEPSSVTHGWSWSNIHKTPSLQMLFYKIIITWGESSLFCDLDFRDGDSCFRVFIQHPFNELLQFATSRWSV